MPPADETEVYHRMHEWYNRPEHDALRAAWGAYPATPGALQSWPGFVAVTNAFLDDAEANASSGEVELEPVKSSGATQWGTVVWGTVVSAAEEGVITEQPSASEGRDGGRGSTARSYARQGGGEGGGVEHADVGFV